jgi:hypothetical protein
MAGRMFPQLAHVFQKRSRLLQPARLPLHLSCRALTSAGILFAQARCIAFREWISF